MEERKFFSMSGAGVTVWGLSVWGIKTETLGSYLTLYIQINLK
jgi:hypothetical protein